MPDLTQTGGHDGCGVAEASVGRVLQSAARRLKSAGAEADEARLESELLLQELVGKSRAWLRAFDDAQLSADEQARFDSLLQRRLNGEPLAYIFGRKDFWSLELQISSAVLVPREDTEVLVAQALRTGREYAIETTQTELDVLELGTGSGAIICALASEEGRWQFTATDVSAEALAVATGNASRHGFARQTKLLLGSWFNALNSDLSATSKQPRFDLILSNPPYIAVDDPHLDAPALRHEPRLALSSGADGLDDIRIIVGEAARWLQASGWLLLEHGYEQGASVRELMREAGFVSVSTELDLAGHPRVTLGRNSLTAVHSVGGDA